MGYTPANLSGGGASIGTTAGIDTITQTLSAGPNVINHGNNARAKSCKVFDSTDTISYNVDGAWQNTDTNNVNIDWIDSDLTNAKIYLTF